jgi:hypothetical protein
MSGGEHGTRNRYNHGCRCPECARANSELARRYRERKRAEAGGVPPAVRPRVNRPAGDRPAGDRPAAVAATDASGEAGGAIMGVLFGVLFTLAAAFLAYLGARSQSAGSEAGAPADGAGGNAGEPAPAHQVTKPGESGSTGLQ